MWLARIIVTTLKQQMFEKDIILIFTIFYCISNKWLVNVEVLEVKEGDIWTCLKQQNNLPLDNVERKKALYCVQYGGAA